MNRVRQTLRLLLAALTLSLGGAALADDDAELALFSQAALAL